MESIKLAEEIDRVETLISQTYGQSSIKNGDHAVPSPKMDKSHRSYHLDDPLNDYQVDQDRIRREIRKPIKYGRLA